MKHYFLIRYYYHKIPYWWNCFGITGIDETIKIRILHSLGFMYFALCTCIVSSFFTFIELLCLTVLHCIVLYQSVDFPHVYIYM